MKKLEYAVSFTTPAFLGNAKQNGQWRTPPFKALFRQWWRVVQVRGGRPDADALHRREGELFGRAADVGTTASQVRLRLDWREHNASIAAGNGKADTGNVQHDEVEKAGKKVDAALYLGYGPLDADKAKGHCLKRESALAPGRSRSLSIAVPVAEEQRFLEVGRLAHAFGALGSRSRNGWGSLHFDDRAKDRALTAEELAAMLDPSKSAGRDWLRPFSRDWMQALGSDWCHAIGRDENGLLIWRTDAMGKWEDVLRRLAEVKIDFRTQFHFKGGGKHSALCDRQVLAYPITKHELQDWEFLKDEKTGKDRKDSSRNANQVLFKVLPSSGGYCGLVAHFPHGLPVPLVQRLSNTDRSDLNAREHRVWSSVHAVLNKSLTRLP